MSGLLPDGACDSHCHVFGPASRFPFAAGRTYTPADATEIMLSELHSRLGIDRAVIVQPAAHGYDNSALLDAISAAPQRRRGVALVPEDVGDDALKRLDDGGVRAVRFNFMPHLSVPPGRDIFVNIGKRIAPFGWHIVVHIGAESLPLLETYLGKTDLPVVIDHMARIPARDGVAQPAFQDLLRLLRRPNIWVKISGADRISATGAPFEDAKCVIQSLVETAPDRVLWGTDWPHPNISGPLPREEDLVTLLTSAVPERARRNAILVTNPDRLYRFGDIAHGSADASEKMT